MIFHDRFHAGRGPDGLARLARKLPDRLAREFGGRYPGLVYQGRIVMEPNASSLISQAITQEKPVAIARLGATEQAVLGRFLLHNRSGASASLARRLKRYPEHVRYDISLQAGVNPPTGETLDRFSRLYLDSLAHIDMLGVWYHLVEQHLVRTTMRDTALVELQSFHPLASTNPWSQSLQGRRVCVVHPFVRSIRSQYERREDLFQDPRILPSFDLRIVEAVQGIGGLPKRYASWFEALDEMTENIAATNAEVVLIAAGAFGLPLAIRAKEFGMRAFHIGGCLQLLFGISGRRWDSDSLVQRLDLGNWVRPSEDERPSKANLVEGACYW